MRFQKAMKRIVALGTGALMLSSAYAAADLANYLRGKGYVHFLHTLQSQSEKSRQAV